MRQDGKDGGREQNAVDHVDDPVRRYDVGALQMDAFLPQQDLTLGKGDSVFMCNSQDTSSPMGGGKEPIRNTYGIRHGDANNLICHRMDLRKSSQPVDRQLIRKNRS